MFKINVRKLSNKKARKRFIRAIANQRTPQASTQRNVLSFRCVLLLLILFLYSLALLHVVNLRFAIGRVRPHRSRLQTHTHTDSCLRAFSRTAYHVHYLLRQTRVLVAYYHHQSRK